MKKYFKISGLIIILLFVVIQFQPQEKNISKEVPTTNFTNLFNAPKKIQQTLHNACYDCHSNNTRHPWYSKIQPVGWYLQNHIKKAKAELNFSEFGSLSDRRQNSKIHSIINQISDDNMPLTSYTLMHKDARLSSEKKKAVIDFMETLKE